VETEEMEQCNVELLQFEPNRHSILIDNITYKAIDIFQIDSVTTKTKTAVGVFFDSTSQLRRIDHHINLPR
jgi:hypothetical protein